MSFNTGESGRCLSTGETDGYVLILENEMFMSKYSRDSWTNLLVGENQMFMSKYPRDSWLSLLVWEGRGCILYKCERQLVVLILKGQMVMSKGSILKPFTPLAHIFDKASIGV